MSGFDDMNQILGKLERKLGNRIKRVIWLNEYIKSGKAKQDGKVRDTKDELFKLRDKTLKNEIHTKQLVEFNLHMILFDDEVETQPPLKKQKLILQSQDIHEDTQEEIDNFLHSHELEPQINNSINENQNLNQNQKQNKSKKKRFCRTNTRNQQYTRQKQK